MPKKLKVSMKPLNNILLGVIKITIIQSRTILPPH